MCLAVKSAKIISKYIWWYAGFSVIRHTAVFLEVAMKQKIIKSILSLLAIACIFCIPVTPVYAEPQGTDGTELQVAQPEQLEIQLGADWAGVEFQMKTDAGMYPGTIPVSQDGVLRLEIGGSKSYILTCMNSSVKAPEPTQVPATTEDLLEDQSQEAASEDEDATVAGIPVVHLCLFAGGMVLAVGGLVTMHVVKKRREEEEDYEYDDEEE